MKILVIGDGSFRIYEYAVIAAMRTLGHTVEEFFWCHYFSSNNMVIRFVFRIQNHFIRGPRILKLNHDVLLKASEFKPELIFIFRGTHIKPEILRELKNNHPGCRVLGYNNDDPFAPGHPRYLWRLFLNGISEYHLMFAYRLHNVNEFLQAGAKQVKLLRGWFISDMHRPVNLAEAEKKKFECDVVFAGHYENDQRLAALESIVRRGWKLNLFGSDSWNFALQKSSILNKFVPVSPAMNDDYAKALCGSKIALCFLSKLNRDTYTSRCFEIPATGSFLLAEYTEDLAALFREGIEAEFFRTPEEMIIKIEIYLADRNKRMQIAAAGCERVNRDQHDIVSRMKQVLEWQESLPCAE